MSTREKRIRLKQFRIGLQLTQPEIAEMLDISKFSYTAIENGTRDGTPEFWAKLQQRFQIPDSKMYGLMKKEGKNTETTV